MEKLMLGTEVAKAMKEELILETEQLKKQEINPCLAIVRVGARQDDLSYERGAKKKMDSIGIECRVTELKEDISIHEFEAVMQSLNEDESVHGILLLRPLPKQLDEKQVKEWMKPEKDMDCMCDSNMMKVFTGEHTDYAPCTAEAVMEMLKYYEIPLAGKRVVIIGRSMVIGKPLSMLMLREHATVTICHSRSEEMEEICKTADILVAAAGKAKMVKASMVKAGAVVVDVGINVDQDGKLCGDVDFDDVEAKVSCISPVPKGVGSITTSVLARHVILAARQQKLNREK